MTDRVNTEIIKQVFQILRENPGISSKVVGPMLTVSAEFVARCSVILYRGTDAEKQAVLAGTLSVSSVGRAIRKRQARTTIELSHVADNRRERADIYQKLATAVEAIAGLPRTSDMVKIIRDIRRGGTLFDNLPIAAKYLAALKFEVEKESLTTFIKELSDEA